eukprot:CCRYP_008670-RA/>CCRYP_008670-RA protein AED:0.05 eAED:0.05 QI:105/1/1/1/0.71/0.62/8/313/890
MTPTLGFQFISLCIVHSLVTLAKGSLQVRYTKNSDAKNPIRSLLQVQDVLSHLNAEHSKGIACAKFTLEIESQDDLIQVDVVESPSAISPSATYSIYNRPSREVGHLGFFNLVTAADGNVVSLTVNSDSGEVRGVVKRFEDEDWIRVDDDVELNSIRSAQRLLYLNSENDLFDQQGVLGSQPNRELQVFHSNYLYQVDLHLDIDYEFVLHNGGTLCNAFEYINSLFVAANVMFEKEIMTHLNIISIRQTDMYDEVDSTDEAMAKVKNEYGGDQWLDQRIDLHYALLGKKMHGGLEQRAGIAFVEKSLCDSLIGFGLVSGVTGSFHSLDERFGIDLTRLMYALAHNFGSGPFGGDLDTLLYSIGGHWSGFGSIADIKSWIDSPYVKQQRNPRKVSYGMFSAVNERAGDCLEVPTTTNVESDRVTGECVPNSSSKSIENDALSLEPNPRESVLIVQLAEPTGSPSHFPTYFPSYFPTTYLPTNTPTLNPTDSPMTSKSSKKPKKSKAGNDDNGSNRKSGKVSLIHKVFVTSVSTREKNSVPSSASNVSKTGKKNDRSKAGKAGSGPKTGKNASKPTSKPSSRPTRKPSKRTRKPTPKPTEKPATRTPTQTPPPSATIPTTTIIDIPAELRVNNFRCADLPNEMAAIGVFESTITPTVQKNLTDSQDLLNVSARCNSSVTSNNTIRRLATTGNETVSFVVRVQQNCTGCSIALFEQVRENFLSEVNSGNFTRNLHIVAFEQNVTEMTNVTIDNMTISDFGNYTIIKEPSTLFPTKAPSETPTKTPTNQPIAQGDPTRNPTTATPTFAPSKSPTSTPTYQPVAPGDPTRNPTTAMPITLVPSNSPTSTPTYQPVAPGDPTRSPTTATPTMAPTMVPTLAPTLAPSMSPTIKPTN